MTQLSVRRVTQSIVAHIDIVTCLALDETGTVLVSGSADTTLCVWPVYTNGDTVTIGPQRRHILRGHDGAVTCVAVNSDLDIVVSGSHDGTCIVHTLYAGDYVRSLSSARPDYLHASVQLAVGHIALTCEGRIIVYSQHVSVEAKVRWVPVSRVGPHRLRSPVGRRCAAAPRSSSCWTCSA